MKQLAILLLPLLVLSACNDKQAPAEKKVDDIVPVRVMVPEPGGASGSLTVSGQFTTDDESVLAFKTGGIIDKILVKEGDAVRAGQLLATLKLTEIDAAVQQATLALEKARRDYNRASNLYKDSVATLEQVQNAKTAVDMATQQLEAARFNRTYSEVRAAKSGFVLRRIAGEGQVVGAGTPVFQVNGASSATWQLRVGLSDRQWTALKVGDKATVANDAGKQWVGTVVRKAQVADPATGLFTADVKVNTTGNDGIASGMYGKATLQIATTQALRVWKIPYDALLDADGSLGYVFVIGADNTARRIPVTIQGMERDRVLISEGLDSVQQLVVSGSAYLTDNSKVRIVQ